MGRIFQRKSQEAHGNCGGAADIHNRRKKLLTEPQFTHLRSHQYGRVLRSQCRKEIHAKSSLQFVTRHVYGMLEKVLCQMGHKFYEQCFKCRKTNTAIDTNPDRMILMLKFDCTSILNRDMFSA